MLIPPRPKYLRDKNVVMPNPGYKNVLIPPICLLFMNSEYALIYMNISDCARILNMHESAKIYPNGCKYASVCLKLVMWLSMPET